MGRLEKQIIIGALVLVGVLLSVVVFKGLKPRSGEAAQDPPLFVVGDIPLAGATKVEPKKVGDAEKPAWPIEPKSTTKLIDDIKLDSVVVQPVVKPSSSKPATPKTPEVRRYIIKSGDTLSEIAQQQLGSSKPVFVQAILDTNPGVTVQNIKPGDVLILPARGSLSASVSDANLKRSKTSTTSVEVRTHTIVSGDSLWKIARKYYSVGNEETGIERIVAANSQLSDGKNSVLKIGKVLVIPK